MGAKAGALFLVDRTAGELIVGAARGPMLPIVGRRSPLAGTIAEKMLQTGHPDISSDLATDERLPAES